MLPTFSTIKIAHATEDANQPGDFGNGSTFFAYLDIINLSGWVSPSASPQRAAGPLPCARGAAGRAWAAVCPSEKWARSSQTPADTHRSWGAAVWQHLDVQELNYVLLISSSPSSMLLQPPERTLYRGFAGAVRFRCHHVWKCKRCSTAQGKV